MSTPKVSARRRNRAKKEVPVVANAKQAVKRRRDTRPVIGKKAMISSPFIHDAKGKEVRVDVASKLEMVKSQKKSLAKAEGQLEYVGLPVNIVGRLIGPADAVLAAQIVTLREVLENPTIFTFPSDGASSSNYVPPTPTEWASYLLMAYIQMFYEEQLLQSSVEGINNAFPKQYAIPVEWAHWCKYQVRHTNGCYQYETRLAIGQDFTLTTSAIVPTASAVIQPYNIAEFCIPTVVGLDDVGVYNWKYPTVVVGAVYDSELYTFAQSYTGIYTGTNSFLNSNRMGFINNLIKRSFNWVALEKVTRQAPDSSAWGVPIAMEGVAPTSWAEFSAIMNNDINFDPQMTVVLRPNIASDTTQLEIAGSFLGAIDCVPMGTQLIGTSSTGIPVVSSLNVSLQYLQQFFWVASKNKYFHGKCFDSNRKSGFRLTFDDKLYYVPDMCKWVARTIDYNTIMRRCLQGLITYVNQSINLQAPTSDLLANYIVCLDSIIYNRVNVLGNCLFATGNRPSPTLLPQSMSPNRCTDLRLPLYLKAILDQIGPVYSGDTFIYPSCYLNSGQTLLTTSNKYLWSKYGLLPNAAPNRLRGNANSVTFSAGDFYVAMNNIFTGNTVTSTSVFTPFNGYGGLDTSATIGATIYKPSYVIQNASQIQANMATITPINGHSPESVFFFSSTSVMWDGVLGYLRLSTINNRAAGGTQYLGLGGPGMFATVVYVDTQAGGLGSSAVTCAMYDTSSGFTSAALLQPNVNNVYEPWSQRRISAIAPLSLRELALVQAFGFCSYYVEIGSLPPIDVRNPIYVGALGSVPGIQVVSAFFGELIGTNTALIDGFQKNEIKEHKVQDMGTALVPVDEATPTDCLKLPLVGAADTISQSMTAINSWTSIIPVPAVARSIWNVSAKALHHYAVGGAKVNKYFSNKRKEKKLAQEVSALKIIQEAVD